MKTKELIEQNNWVTVNRSDLPARPNIFDGRASYLKRWGHIKWDIESQV